MTMNSSPVEAGDTMDHTTMNQFRQDVLTQVGEYVVSTGSANAYVLAIDDNDDGDSCSKITAINEGHKFYFKANFSNTGACTLTIKNVGGDTILAATAMKDASGAALAADAIVSGNLIQAWFDGTNFRILNITLYKASHAQAEAGSNDTTFMTPYASQFSGFRRILTLGGTVAQNDIVYFDGNGKLLNCGETDLIIKTIDRRGVAQDYTGSAPTSGNAFMSYDEDYKMLFFTGYYTPGGNDSGVTLAYLFNGKNGDILAFTDASNYCNGSGSFAIGFDFIHKYFMMVGRAGGAEWHYRGGSYDINGNMTDLTTAGGNFSPTTDDGSAHIDIAYDQTADAWLVYRYDNVTNAGRYIVGTISGTAITWGTLTATPDTAISSPKINYDPKEGKVVCWRSGGIRVATVTGGSTRTASFSNETALTGTPYSISYDPINEKHLLLYDAGTTIKARMGSVNASTGVFDLEGTEKTVFNISSISGVDFFKPILTYSEKFGGWICGANNGNGAIIRISGGDIQITAVTFDKNISSILDIPGTDYFALHYDTSYYRLAEIVSRTADDYIGIAEEAGVLNDTKQCLLKGGIIKGLTGLTPGNAYYKGGKKIGVAISTTEVLTYRST